MIVPKVIHHRTISWRSLALVDIYALGATLHHALTRRDPRLEPPFSFGERPLRRINSRVSPELEAVVDTALQYNLPNDSPARSK